MAKRYESFNKGVSFSDRSVKINERVFVKFSEISTNWSGVIRFGFTYHDPSTLRNNLPKYACPDLTNRPGFWAKALNERYCQRDNILFYYITSSGDVYYGVNGEEKGVFISGVETRGPLWALIDIYGNCSTIEFLGAPHNRAGSHQSLAAPAPEVEVDQILPSMQALSMSDVRPSQTQRGDFTPVPFHTTRGSNVALSADKLIAARVESEFCQGYVFTARPIRINEKLIVQVLRTERMYVGALALGLTSCDPATLQPSDLPDDSEQLLDRPEYWVVSKDIASSPSRGDEIAFMITSAGEVQISKNNGPPTVVMHVDQSLRLWAFLDVYGSTQSVRILSQMTPSPQYSSPVSASSAMLAVPRPVSQRFASQILPPAEPIEAMQSPSMPAPIQQRRSSHMSTPSLQTSRVISSNDMIQLQPGGTVLVVNLPPATSSSNLSSAAPSHQPQITQIPMIAQSAQMASANDVNYEVSVAPGRADRIAPPHISRES